MSTTNPAAPSIDADTVKHALYCADGTATTSALVEDLSANRLTVNVILKRLEKRGIVTSYRGPTELVWEFTEDFTPDADQ